MLMCCGRLGGWPSTGVGAKGGIGSGLWGRPSPTGMGGLGGRLLWSASTGVCRKGAWLLWLALAALDSRGRDRRLAYCCRCRPALKGVGGTCSGALLPALAALSALDERERRRGAAAGAALARAGPLGAWGGGTGEGGLLGCGVYAGHALAAGARESEGRPGPTHLTRRVVTFP